MYMYACYLLFNYVQSLAVQLLEAIRHRTADGVARDSVARPSLEVAAGDLDRDEKEEKEEEEADEDSSDTSDYTSSPSSKEQITEDVRCLKF